MGDLTAYQQRLGEFLRLSLKVDVSPSFGKLVVASDKGSVQELQRLVTKFIYKQNLNSTHFAALKGSTVKISRFKEEKHEKRSKNPTPPTKFAHGF